MSSKYFHTWTAQNQSIDLDIDKSDGSYFIYQDKRILDFTSISFQANWGHSHEHLNNKIKAVSYTHLTLPTTPYV